MGAIVVLAALLVLLGVVALSDDTSTARYRAGTVIAQSRRVSAGVLPDTTITLDHM